MDSDNDLYWPMIILRSPKGWTGPKEVDGKPVEEHLARHQVPMDEMRSNPDHVKILEKWMKSYKPEELFDENGKLIPKLQNLLQKDERRMGANPHANGGLLHCRDLQMPEFRDYAVESAKTWSESWPKRHGFMGKFIRDVIKAESGSAKFSVVQSG